MTLSTERTPLLESYPAEKAGEGLWNVYADAAGEEGKNLGDSAKRMSSVLVFSIVFAGIITLCLIESFRVFTLDTSTQTIAPLARLTANTRIPVAVVSLWLASLVILILCALLVMLIQEWTSDFVRGQTRPRTATIQQYCFRLIAVHMGAQRYGLDRALSLVDFLVHSAVIIFLVGLVILSFAIHPVLALVATILTAVPALLYLIASFIPLFDEDCPYNTPLTRLLRAIFIPSIVFLFCLSLYSRILLLAARCFLKHGRLDSFSRSALRPRSAFSFMLNPFASWALLKPPAKHFALKSHDDGGKTSLRTRTWCVGDAEAQPGCPSMSTDELEFIWDRVASYALDNPGALQYIACLVDRRHSNAGSLFIDLRSNGRCMVKIAATLHSVDSTFAAVGSIRLLQVLFSADARNDEHSLAVDDEDGRWKKAGPILDAFPAFAERLGSLNAEALKTGDMSVLNAVSSFRWTLILLWSRSSIPSDAGDCLRRLLRDLCVPDGLRLLPLSSSDYGDPEDIFGVDNDPRLELASRNAFTLLEKASACGWPRDWKNPDRPYLKDSAPDLWHWHQLFADEIGRRSRGTPSRFLLDMLNSIGPDVEGQPGSAVVVANGEGLDPVALKALRDLTSMVEPHLPN